MLATVQKRSVESTKDDAGARVDASADTKAPAKQSRPQPQQHDSYGDALPTIIASLVSATLASMILRELTNERELLLALFALLTLAASGAQIVVTFLFRWDDGVIDSFEHANLRPLLFVSSVLYFLTVQFGVTVLTDAISLFQRPSTPDLILAAIVILAAAFFLYPYFIKIGHRPAPQRTRKRRVSF